MTLFIIACTTAFVDRHRLVGLVTLEDLMEEIVGELPDEFDHLSDEIIAVRDRRWKIGGGALLGRVAGQTGLALAVNEPNAVLTDRLRREVGREPRGGRHGARGGHAIHRDPNPAPEGPSPAGGAGLILP